MFIFPTFDPYTGGSTTSTSIEKVLANKANIKNGRMIKQLPIAPQQMQYGKYQKMIKRK
jgi:hypothetical protein